VFRNGQLLNNDQYNLTDTNKITIVSTSFKIGANYTVATVSGIGSVGSAQAGNPVYPEAGIALSTGTTWASSITNNSSNWNTAYNDKINSLSVTGTTTKTITLTQQDGGTVSGNFSDNGSVTSINMTVPTGLTISGQPITTSGTLALSYASGYAIPTDIKQNEWNTAYNDKINNAAFTGTDTKTLTLTQLDGGTLTPTFNDLQGVTGVTAGTGLTGGTITTTGTVAVDFTTVAPLANPTFTGTVGGITKNMVGLGNVDNTSDANKPISSATQTALNLKANLNSPTFTGTVSGIDKSMVGLGNVDNTSDANKPISSATQTALNLKENTITAGTSGQYYRGDKTFQTLDKTAVGLGNVDNTSDANKPISSATQTALNLKLNTSDTTILNLSSRFAAKQNTLTNPVTGTGTTNNLPLFTGTSTLGNSVIQQSSNNIGINTTPFASLTLGQGKNILLDASSNNIPKILFYESGARNENDVQFGAKIQYHSINDRLEFVMRDSFAADPSGDELAISIVRQTGNVTIHKPTTLSSTLAVTEAVTLSTTSATPATLLGKDGSNVVGTVTTVAQTGLMTRNIVTNASTISGSELINVTHGLGSEPTAVLLTVFGSTSYILQVASKNSSTFTVQVKNYNGTPAIDATLISFSWLAIK
jgi:hypothetical protein